MPPIRPRHVCRDDDCTWLDDVPCWYCGEPGEKVVECTAPWGFVNPAGPNADSLGTVLVL